MIETKKEILKTTEDVPPTVVVPEVPEAVNDEKILASLLIVLGIGVVFLSGFFYEIIHVPSFAFGILQIYNIFTNPMLVGLALMCGLFLASALVMGGFSHFDDSIHNLFILSFSIVLLFFIVNMGKFVGCMGTDSFSTQNTWCMDFNRSDAYIQAHLKDYK